MIGKQTLAIDIQTLETPDRNRGIGRYTSGLISGLLESSDAALHLCGFAEKCSFDCPDNLQSKIIYHQYPDSINRDVYLSNGVSAPLADCFDDFQPDIFIASSPLMPDVLIPNRSAAKMGCILYDLIPKIFRGAHPEILPENLWHVQEQREQLIRKYDFAFSISESTRKDAIERLNWCPDRIHNILTTIDPRFFNAKNNREILTKYKIGTSYILSVSGYNFRKNWQGGLEAFAVLSKQSPKELQFVLVCTLTDEQREEVFAYAAKLKIEKQLIITGFVPNEDLPTLYQNAKLFLFPSFYEGFGIPVAEAMASRCPVVSADNSSLPEVVGNAGLLAKATDPQAMADAMLQILEQPKLRESLIEKGFARSKDFNWNFVAEGFISAINKFSKEQKNNVSKPTLVFPPKDSNENLMQDIGKIIAAEMNREFSTLPVNHDDAIYMLCNECSLEKTLSALYRNGGSAWFFDEDLKPALKNLQQQGIVPLAGLQSATFSNLDVQQQNFKKQIEDYSQQQFNGSIKLIESAFAEERNEPGGNNLQVLLLADYLPENLSGFFAALEVLKNWQEEQTLFLTIAGRAIEPQVLRQVYLSRRHPALLENLRIKSLASLAELQSLVAESRFVWLPETKNLKTNLIYKAAAASPGKIILTGDNPTAVIIKNTKRRQA